MKHRENDVSFYVSGAVGSRGTAMSGSAVFGGDVYVSGALFSEQGFSGSITKIASGLSYLFCRKEYYYYFGNLMDRLQLLVSIQLATLQALQLVQASRAEVILDQLH